MNLDNFATFPSLDTQGFLAQIDGLPEQLWSAWELGQRQPLPAWQGIRQVVVAGMGGSAIGADLLAAYLAPICPAPLYVHRDYGLPAWARGEHTLLIASSKSGDTEETLSSFQAGVDQGCRLLAISTGGTLARAAAQAGAPAWQFSFSGQPRAAVGFSFGLLLAVFARLGLIPDPADDLRAATAAMRAQQASLKAEVPIVQNPAKRIAGQMMGRWVVVVGAGVLEPVARRWKGQISEVAKAWAQFEALPEMDHNTLAGVNHPQEHLPRTLVLFLRAPSDHPRNRLRIKLTKRALMLEGIGTDFVNAQGRSPLENLWTALHFGDYTAYYLAMSYDVDPTPIAAIESFKEELKAAR